MKNISIDIHLDIQLLDMVKKLTLLSPNYEFTPRLLFVIKVKLDA